jgi:hypothetical protein
VGDEAKLPKMPRERESETRIKSVEEQHEQVLRRARRKAHTLRNHGWTYEMQGRETGFREASEVVKKWLVKDGPVSKSEIEFVVQLLEQSADLYASATPSKK